MAAVLNSMAMSRLALSRGHRVAAELHMREAAAAEAAMLRSYIEPPRLPNPSLQCLGWLLLHLGKARSVSKPVLLYYSQPKLCMINRRDCSLH